MLKLRIKIIFLFSLMLLFILKAFCAENTFISISPAMTEIIYMLNAQDKLLAVSNECTFPKEVKTKEKIGSGYMLNYERIIKLKPTYILGFDSSIAQLSKFKYFKIIPICYKYSNIDEILDNIRKVAKLCNKEKEAQVLIKTIENKIKISNKSKNKRILYLLQNEPMMTIGAKSFITDVIKKSGNHSISENLSLSYPLISKEYAIKQAPDIIVLTYYTDDKKIKSYFPKAKIVKLTIEQTDIINRPGPRIYQAVEFFSNL